MKFINLMKGLIKSKLNGAEDELKSAKIPVTLREYLTLLEAMDADVANGSVEGFYYLSAI
mgnify:CR=1 FL=1